MNSLLTTTKYIWTQHAQQKMRYYQLSTSRIRRVLKTPLRIEEGIADNTAAAMQPTSYKTKDGVRSWSQEIWVLFKSTNIKDSITKKENKGIKIISAWRYPGKTKPRDELPSEIWSEIEEALNT